MLQYVDPVHCPRFEAGLGNAGAVEEALTLLDRYPNVSEIELARLINHYRGFSALNAALLISNDRVAPKLDRFIQDHRSRLNAPFRQYAVLVAMAVFGVATIALALL